jgi:hypothetical protein
MGESLAKPPFKIVRLGCIFNFLQDHSCLLFFILLSFIVFCLRANRGTLPGVVTSGDSVTHKYFHRNEKAGL